MAPLPCHCAPYAAALRPERTLATDVAAGLRHLQPDGARFDSRIDRKAIERLAADAAARVPAECRGYVEAPRMPRAKLVARVAVDGNYGALGASYSGAVQLKDTYVTLYRYVKWQCVIAYGEDEPKCSEESYLSSRVSEMLAPGKAYETLTTGITDNEEYAEYFGQITEEQARILEYYDAFARIDTRKDALDYLGGVAGELTVEEKLLLTQTALNRWNSGYDEERMELEAAATGSVGFSTLQDTAGHNNSVGYYGYGEAEGDRYTEAEWAGVCRDMAAQGAAMLGALGAKHSYVVAYATTSGAYHVDIVTTFDERQGTVYRVDYDGELSQTVAGDERALRGLRNDVAVTYLLARPDGRIVADVPSEQGLLLAEAAGMDARDLAGGLSRAKTSLVGAEMPIHPAKDDPGAHLRAVAAQDSFGARYLMAGGSHDYAADTNHPGRIGWVVGAQTRPAGTFVNDGAADETMPFAYVMLDQDINTREYKISKGRKAGIDTEILAVFMTGKIDGAPWEDLILQGDFRYNVGGHLTASSPLGRDTLTHAVTAQLTPGVKDVTDPHMPQVPTVVLNRVEYGGEYRHRLSSDPAKAAALVVAATAAVNPELGAAGRLEAGIVGARAGVTAFVEGPIGEVAPYLPGTDPAAGASFVFDVGPRTRFDLGGAYGRDQGFSADGNLTVKF